MPRSRRAAITAAAPVPISVEETADAPVVIAGTVTILFIFQAISENSGLRPAAFWRRNKMMKKKGGRRRTEFSTLPSLMH